MRTSVVLMLMVLTLMFSVPGLSGKALSQQSTITVKIADHFPSGHPLLREFTRPWMARVEELTKGVVKFNHYPAQQLVKQREALPAIQRAIVDIGSMNPGAFTTELPLSGVVFLPNGYDTVMQGGKAIKKLFDFNPIKKEFSKSGVKLLIIIPIDPFEIFTSERLVRKPDDVKGLKLRALGQAQIWATRSLEGTPVTVGAPEVYTAIQRNTLDGALWCYSTAKSYKLGEVVHYITIGSKVGYSLVTYVANERFWNGLDPSIQNAMLQAAAEIMQKGWGAFDELANSAKHEYRSKGLVLTQITEDNQPAWQEKLQPVRNKWAANMEASGLPGGQVLSAWDKALAETK